MKQSKSVKIMENPAKNSIIRGPVALEDEETGSWSSDQEELSKRCESIRTQSHSHSGDLHMLKHCSTRGYPKKSVVKFSDILTFHEEAKQQAEEKDVVGRLSRTAHELGYICDTRCLLYVLEKAKMVGEKIGLEKNDDFHYQEFNFFHTVLISRYPWMRHELLFAFGLVFCFYLLTPILFCSIMHDDGICPQNSKVPGWVSALYFGSATMSTVGYGDFSVEKNEPWKVAIGALYMIMSMLVALLAFSAAAEKAMSPFKSFVKFIAPISPISYPEGPLGEGEYLYQRIRKVKWVALCDVAFQFIILNGIGVMASQAFIEFAEVDPGRQWGWVDSAYWAVQTTTTIGYGDYSMPEYMQPFLIFYLTLGTYFTGSSLGRLQALRDELEAIRRYHAFERREVNKHMMHFLASTDDPTRVDQYEFVIAQLLNLRKIDANDITPIMDKFRKLARGRNTGFIQVEDIPEETDEGLNALSEVEGVEGA